MFNHRNKIKSLSDIEAWPLYMSLPQWASFLGMKADTLRKARQDGLLEVDLIGNRGYATKTQVLKWYAPSLYKEYEVGREMKA